MKKWRRGSNPTPKELSRPEKKNLGQVINGAPRSLSPEGSETLSVKIPVAMKRAITASARNQNISTSELVRSLLAKSMTEA